MLTAQQTMDIIKVWNHLQYSKRVSEIPYIQFPAERQIQPLPNFWWSVARFMVKSWDKAMSVYLDCYDALWVFWEPYWEAYPCKEYGFRCAMNNTNALIEAMQEEFNS